MDATMKELLCADTLKDRRSLLFENGLLRQIDDPMDADGLPEGRMGEFPRLRLQTALGVPLLLPITRASACLKDADVVCDTPTACTLRASSRFLSLEKRDAPEPDADLVSWPAGQGDERAEHWVGIFSGEMVGIVSRFTGNDGSSYVLTYAGTGNFTDIRMEHSEILGVILRRVLR